LRQLRYSSTTRPLVLKVNSHAMVVTNKFFTIFARTWRWLECTFHHFIKISKSVDDEPVHCKNRLLP